jgi:DNA (cytosine-5)-methyltransferase 1
MNTGYVYDNKVCQTLTSKGNCGSLLFSKPIRLSKKEFCNIGSFPQDYNFTCNFGYLIGMSVPPVMTAQIASKIYEQWLCKIKITKN